jgi:hypothetical protein
VKRQLARVSPHILRACGILLGLLGVACGWMLILQPPSAEEVDKGVRATVIRHLSLRDASIEDALAEILRHVSAQNSRLGPIKGHLFRDDLSAIPEPAPVDVTAIEGLDQTGASGNTGIMIASGDAGNPQKITVDLHDIRADQALDYVAGLAHQRWTTRAGAVYFYPLTTGPAGWVPPLTASERAWLKWRTFRDRVSSWWR